jgi:multidrug resistance efflux pump
MRVNLSEDNQEEILEDKIAKAKEEIIQCAQELARPKNLGQREYIEWEASAQDKLRLAVFKLEKYLNK